MHPFGDIGLWAQCRDGEGRGNRPALFLDRDGVVVEEVHFLRRAADVVIMPGMAAAIAAANAADIPVIVVTNQSGIGRGHFGWEDFAAVQAEIVSRLAGGGAWCDALFACAHFENAEAPYDRDVHGWRKPMPGMLLEARTRMGVDLARSLIIGDRVSDLEAGRNAGLCGGTLVLTGYGATHVAALEANRQAWSDRGFAATVAADPAVAVRDSLNRILTAG